MNKEFVKPKAPIIGADSNIFNLLHICSDSLSIAGYKDKSKEMTDRVLSSSSYDEALAILCEYIEPVNYGYSHFDELDDYEEYLRNPHDFKDDIDI